MRDSFFLAAGLLFLLLLLLLFFSHTAAGSAPVDSEHVRRYKTTNTCQIKKEEKKPPVFTKGKERILMFQARKACYKTRHCGLKCLYVHGTLFIMIIRKHIQKRQRLGKKCIRHLSINSRILQYVQDGVSDVWKLTCNSVFILFLLVCHLFLFKYVYTYAYM